MRRSRVCWQRCAACGLLNRRAPTGRPERSVLAWSCATRFINLVKALVRQGSVDPGTRAEKNDRLDKNQGGAEWPANLAQQKAAGRSRDKGAAGPLCAANCQRPDCKDVTVGDGRRIIKQQVTAQLSPQTYIPPCRLECSV